MGTMHRDPTLLFFVFFELQLYNFVGIHSLYCLIYIILFLLTLSNFGIKGGL
jgi:hypothetical protein